MTSDSQPEATPCPAAPEPARAGRVAAARRTRDWDVVWERYGITAVLLVVWVIAAILIPNFATRDNLISVLRQSSFVGVAAIGMTIAILSGTFDLSVGSTLGLCAVVAVSVARVAGVVPAIFAALVVGLIIGAINGTLVSIVRIPAFIATLGMLFVIRGFTFVVMSGEAARFNGKSFIWLGNGTLVKWVPVPFAVFIVCALIGALLLRYTAFGRYVYAIGTNSVSALVAGVPIRWVTAMVFMVVGLFTAVAAVLIGARLYSAGPGLEPGFELRVIATVVLGGTRLSGGRGSMLGTVAAAILFATLANMLNLIHADSFVQRVAVGMVLLLALSIEGIRQRIAERLSRKLTA
jgi:ribose/xylose/arabinose/galactoside ABC-type transport system permease subunit